MKTASRVLVTALLVLLSGCASRYFRDAGSPPLPPPRHSLVGLPQAEYWTGIVFNGSKIGFSHTRVSASAEQGLYELHGEAVFRFRMLGFEKRVEVRSLDTVDANARLVRFTYHYLLDDTEQDLSGEVRDRVLRYRVSTGKRPAEQKEETLAEDLYPSGALNLLPVLKGLQTGSIFHWLVFNGETQSLDRAEQRIVAYETSDLFPGAAFKVQTDMLGMSSTAWIDSRGLPVFELAMNGVMISALEEEAAAKRYLTSAALNKDEVFLSWSLIKAPLPATDARRTRFLKFALLDPGRRAPLADSRQSCAASAGDLVCVIDATRSTPDDGATQSALLPSGTIQSRDPMIRKLAQTIAAGRESPAEKIDAVLGWLEQNIRKEAVDTFSALDVLDARSGECQGHAYLYTALMRALGVPTRVVNGLVYSPEHKGFLYHSWAESFVDGGWRAVDPTFNQNPADATHIALVRGETLVELAPLIDWVGNTRIKVLEAR